MVRMQPGVGSVEQAQVRDQPELHFTITESLYKVFVRVLIAIAKQMTRTISCCHDISPCSTPERQYAHLPGSVSQFLHQLTYHEEGIFSIFTICEEGVFSRFPLIYSHFHSRLLTTSEKSKISSENFLQPPQGQQSKSCRRWTPPSAVRLPPYHEKASVSCAFCLNMTFLVNKGR